MKTLNEVILYKEYVGSVRYSLDDKVFFGKIEGIEHLVTFGGEDVSQLKVAVHEAVHDLIEIGNSFN